MFVAFTVRTFAQGWYLALWTANAGAKIKHTAHKKFRRKATADAASRHTVYLSGEMSAWNIHSECQGPTIPREAR